jgi:hypothetical protein
MEDIVDSRCWKLSGRRKKERKKERKKTFLKVLLSKVRKTL